MVQTGGQPETVLALITGKVQAAALSVPATMRAKKANMRELLDMAKLEATIHQNGVVTTRRYLKTNEDTVRRFLRAYIEGAVLAKKDKAFATRVMAKYLGTDDREMLDDAYERVTLHLEIPPHPTVEGVSVLLKTLEKAQPKARTVNREDFIDGRLVREIEKRFYRSAVTGAQLNKSIKVTEMVPLETCACHYPVDMIASENTVKSRDGQQTFSRTMD